MSDPIPIRKTVYEEIIWTHQMRRDDGDGWLGATETIATIVSSKIYDEAGVEKSGMLSSVTIVENTKIGFIVAGGTAPVSGKIYTPYIIKFKITTSLGNKMEPKLELYVTD